MDKETISKGETKEGRTSVPPPVAGRTLPTARESCSKITSSTHSSGEKAREMAQTHPPFQPKRVCDGKDALQLAGVAGFPVDSLNANERQHQWNLT